MGQCAGCVKYLLFIFNFCLWLLGCALLSVGIWMKMDGSANHYVQRMTDMEKDDKYQISYSAIGEKDVTTSLAYVLIVFGIIIIIITFIGCCGAVRENSCLLGTYAISLSVLMVALIGIGAWAIIKKDNLNTYTDDLRNRTDGNLETGISLYYKDEVSKQFIDNVQKKFSCCGCRNGRNDYKGVEVPESCGKNKENVQGCSFSYFWYVGKEIKEFLTKRYTIIAGVSIGVAVCLALGTSFTLLLCCLVRRQARIIVT